MTNNTDIIAEWLIYFNVPLKSYLIPARSIKCIIKYKAADEVLSKLFIK